MAQVQRGSRVDLSDLKARMLKTLGPTKESQYSSLLASFFQLKLSKAELDRLVPSTIGKENLLLHNNFVRAILHNVMCGEAPPPPAHSLSKPLKGQCSPNCNRNNRRTQKRRKKHRGENKRYVFFPNQFMLRFCENHSKSSASIRFRAWLINQHPWNLNFFFTFTVRVLLGSLNVVAALV